MLTRVIAENWRTIKRMNAYNFEQRDAVERVVTGACNFMCSHKRLCMVELAGGNADQVIRQDYTVGDALDYYDDRKEKTEYAQ
jgi:hypothetical protein